MDFQTFLVRIFLPFVVLSGVAVGVGAIVILPAPWSLAVLTMVCVVALGSLLWVYAMWLKRPVAPFSTYMGGRRQEGAVKRTAPFTEDDEWGEPEITGEELDEAVDAARKLTPDSISSGGRDFDKRDFRRPSLPPRSTP